MFIYNKITARFPAYLKIVRFTDHHWQWASERVRSAESYKRSRDQTSVYSFLIVLPDRFLLAEHGYVTGCCIGEKLDNVARAITWRCMRRLRRENRTILRDSRPLRWCSRTTNTIYNTVRFWKILEIDGFFYFFFLYIFPWEKT